MATGVMVNVETLDRPATGRIAAGEHRFPLRVYVEDTDLGGIVYHANFLRFMERARTDMLELAGIDQREAIARGQGIYVISALSIQYHRPAGLGDILIVVSRMTETRPASCVIHQRVMRGLELVAEADVTAVLVSPTGRPKRQPQAWLEAFRRLQGEEDTL
jgi:acyl-CoA thioester hydrolase